MADLTTIKAREIMVKKPFRRILPEGYTPVGNRALAAIPTFSVDTATYQAVKQADFLREFEPTGHKINSPLFYPDRMKQDPDTKKYYIERVVRCSFAFQRIITIKQLTHLCGNDIQFEIPESKDTDATNETYFKFREGWAVKDMEIAWYEACRSIKITGDTAFVGYVDKGIFGWKVLSYLNGDTLYPHYDPITGKLAVLGRAYEDLDEDGHTETEWLEVWDNEFLYRFKKGRKGKEKVVNLIKGIFGVSGYTQVSKELHGFPFIPVAYHRTEEGACWTPAQGSIEDYELSFSQMVQSNTAYAFPIMYLKGDDVDVQGDANGVVKVINLGSEDEAGYLQKQDISNSFNVQLEKLYKMIYEQAFSVIPPEVRSGDLPGVAVKLLYSPAVENAMKDAQEINPFLDNIVKIYTHGYGVETKNIVQFTNLNVYAWIEPYIHQNDTELITNLATSVQNGFLSCQTATEKSKYSKNAEFDRIMKEEKKQQENDLLVEIKRQKETAAIQKQNAPQAGAPNQQK